MIIGDKVELLPFNGDEPDYSEWFNNKEVCKYNNHHRLPIDVKEKSRPPATFKIFATHGCYDWIGNISLQCIDYINSQAELSIIIGLSNTHGKGYGYEACKLLVEHAFEQLNLNRIYLGTHEDNIGMQKIANKLGFKEEGRRRQAIYKNGKYSDIIEYGILRGEYNGKK